MSAVQDGIQFCYACDEGVLECADFSSSDAVLHRLKACGEAANDKLRAGDGVPTQVQFGVILYGAREEKPRHTCLSIVLPHRLKVAVHQMIVLNGRQKIRGSEGVHVDGSVRDVASRQNVGCFGQYGGLTGTHGTCDEERTRRSHSENGLYRSLF